MYLDNDVQVDSGSDQYAVGPVAAGGVSQNCK